MVSRAAAEGYSGAVSGTPGHLSVAAYGTVTTTSFDGADASAPLAARTRTK